MRRIALLLLVGVVAFLMSGCQRGASAGGTSAGGTGRARDLNGSLVFDSLTRTYHLHLPPQVVAAKALPLVLVLHGRDGTGSGMIGLTHMNDIADQQGFIAVYPDGYANSWADGRGVTTADQHGVDDVGFIAALIDTLVASYPVDASRVYVTGLSNGGFMSERLACDLASKIAAAAPVAGPLSEALVPRCAPSRPMPLLLIEGTADPLVPFAGGEVAGKRGIVLSAAATVAHWATLDQCPATPVNEALPDIAHDGTQVSRAAYAPCAGDVAVMLYTVEGGGHTWPSGQQYLPGSAVGRTTHQIDNVTIWDFLRQFHLPR